MAEEEASLVKQEQLNLFLDAANEARESEMRSVVEGILDELDRRGVDRDYFLLEWKLKEVIELLAQFPEQKRHYFAVRLCESVFPE